jgi:hypothetical protein
MMCQSYAFSGPGARGGSSGPGHREDELPPGVAALEVAYGVGCLAQRVPVSSRYVRNQKLAIDFRK